MKRMTNTQVKESGERKKRNNHLDGKDQQKCTAYLKKWLQCDKFLQEIQNFLKSYAYLVPF